MRGLDTYTLVARLLPALLIIGPVLVAFLPAMASAPQRWAAAAGGAGVWVLVALAVRRLGRWREPTLLARWGGDYPTTTALLLTDTTTSAVTKQRRRSRLAALYGHPLPTHEEETADPRSARERLRDAELVLRSHVRAHPDLARLTPTENRTYGLLRNAWAIKPLGLSVAVLVLASASALGLTQGWTAHLWITAGTSTATVLLWALLITPAVAHKVAQDYADRLLEALDHAPDAARD